MTLTRRDLIAATARAGGANAAYRTMAAMGLLAATDDAHAEAPALPPGAGVRVLVLGAGIAGMVCAWSLSRAGYDVRVLEARSRAGGRNWSLRAGDVIEEDDAPPQFVRWATGEHLYVNPGPARIPHHHTGILGVCRELGVKLEVICNDNRGALLHDDKAFGGKPVANRGVVGDMRGFVAELAAKAVDHDAMAAPVDAADLEQLRAMLRQFGALDRDMKYRGSSRAGWASAPGGGDESGVKRTPLDLAAIVRSSFWQGPTQFGEGFLQAPSMMQPVGGMGVIGQMFGRKLAEIISYNAEVTAIRREGAGARVAWRDRTSGEARSADADILICTLPLPMLGRIADTDLSDATKRAIAACEYVPAGKIAFQAERRFWEDDASIYGGISWTSRPSTQVWYPTAGLQQRRGILLGAYIWDEEIGRAFAAKSNGNRLADTLSDLEALHPGCTPELSKGVSVAWPRIPFSGGAWAEWSSDARATAYKTLLAGDGPVLFAGEHMSFITGWQEGAVRSAHVALAAVGDRVRARPL